MKFGTRRMYHTDIVDPLAFHLAAPSGQNHNLSNMLAYISVKLMTPPSA